MHCRAPLKACFRCVATAVALASALVVAGMSRGVPLSDGPEGPLFQSQFAGRTPNSGAPEPGPEDSSAAAADSTDELLDQDVNPAAEPAGQCHLRDCDAICDDGPRRAMYVLLGYDSWRGLVDGTWGNNGMHTGLNFGTRLGRFSDWTGLGGQIGGTVGVYNWAGTDYRLQANDQAQPQGMITYGLFRRSHENCRWSGGIVHDWMINANYGVFAENPTLAQWRGQIAYATSAANEFGMWSAWRLHKDRRFVPGFGDTIYRPLGQISGFWHHKWGAGGADTWLFIGAPEQGRVTGNGTLGDYVVTALANAPLNDWVGLYSQVSYMHQSGSPGPASSPEDAWMFGVGLAFYPGGTARSSTVAGRCWMPLMPLANNGFFLVDTNNYY